MSISYQEAVSVSTTIEIIACIFALFIFTLGDERQQRNPLSFWLLY